MSKQIQYVNSRLRPVVVMSNFTHLDESIVTPKRARISKLFNGADSVYRATRVRVSSSPSVCRMKNKVFFLDSEHICTNELSYRWNRLARPFRDESSVDLRH